MEEVGINCLAHKQMPNKEAPVVSAGALIVVLKIEIITATRVDYFK